MCARNETMMGLGLILALVGWLSPVQAAERRTLAEGDVTITATSEENVTCDDCPDGKTGTKICYQVTLDQGATNTSAKDFHIQVSDGFAANYKCKEVHEFVDGQWVVRGWSFAYASQMEGEVRRHYISWFRDSGAQHLNGGETWRFCFVYCGPTNNLDNTIEWILTHQGSNLPGVPDANGNRADVPNSGDSDDPGWSGTKTTASGSKVGFALAACIMPDGTCEDDVADFECLESDGEPQGDGSICGEQICTADLDGNGVVNAGDLAILLGSWGACAQCIADFNGDGVVNAGDLGFLLGSWGECPQSAVCGDGVVGEGEQCDPPDGVTCDDNCQLIDQECPFPDIRSIVSDSEFDVPHVQRNYDAINQTLHLFGDLTFEDFFYSSFEVLVPGMLERLETLDTCTGNPIEMADIAAVLQFIADLAGDLTPAEVVSSPVGEMDEIKAAIDDLRTYGIAFPPMASTDADAKAQALSIEILTIEAGVLTYADMYFLPYDEIGEEQLEAVMQANQSDGVLDYQAIGVDGDVHAIIPNDRCCEKNVCEPDVLDLDECHAEDYKPCYIPGSTDNCGICSVGSKDCS